MSLSSFVAFLIHYKYIALFPFAILEGPIVSIIGGFLISHGTLSFVPTLGVVWFGDVLSDSFFYFLGRSGRRFMRFIRISDAQFERIENQYARSPWKTMVLAKLSYGFGVAFMTASGVAKMSYKNFFYSMTILNALRSLILVSIGYYFGKLAVVSGQQYLDYYLFIVCVCIPVLYLYIKKKS